MLEELEKAKKFIFLEYFIIEEGYMWGRILDILTRKADEGVEVRVMYDGTCDFSKLPHDYPKRLRSVGIQCRVWERIKPVITSSYNYRDHRKLLIIDGKTAFCGGINLADEYINHIQKFGQWKDTAVMLEGAAVDEFTVMFLKMWNIKESEPEDFSLFLGKYDKSIHSEGCVIPYSESPLNEHQIAERVYSDILYTAKEYVYIMTPYLVLDDELMSALKTHYKSLIKAGVQIYEYTPGFVHSKIFLSDNIKAVVGTINLDYRSLYHHFECALYLCGTPSIKDIQSDFSDVFSKSKEITIDSVKHEKIIIKLTGAVMRLIAPLL